MKRYLSKGPKDFFMIENSFIILEKINVKTEKMLWNQGINTWDDFLSAKTIRGISPKRKGHYDRFLKKAKLNLQHRNEAFFYQRFPLKEAWRLYDHFKDQAVYLDIETCRQDEITVVGLYNGDSPKVLIRGYNLDKRMILSALEGCKLIVTFNGSSFDIPLINRYYGGVIGSIPHLDLRYACAQVGLRGGLKRIEKEIGISRPEEVKDISGGDAVLLWKKWWATRNEKYLRQLIQYNMEDILNLKPLAEFVVNKLKSHFFEKNI